MQGETRTGRPQPGNRKRTTVLMKVLCQRRLRFRLSGVRWPAMQLAGRTPAVSGGGRRPGWPRVGVMSIDAAAFKKGMRHLAASVTLITTRHRELRGGLTATAVCSVSAEPPQILVCVNKTASRPRPDRRGRLLLRQHPGARPSQDRRALRRHGRRRRRRAFPRHGRMVEPVDRRAGAEGLPGVVRLPAGDQGRGRHPHDLYRRDRRPRARCRRRTPLLYADGNFVHGDALKKAAQAA